MVAKRKSKHPNPTFENEVVFISLNLTSNAEALAKIESVQRLPKITKPALNLSLLAVISSL